jgi:hypothetical protein
VRFSRFKELPQTFQKPTAHFKLPGMLFLPWPVEKTEWARPACTLKAAAIFSKNSASSSPAIGL